MKKAFRILNQIPQTFSLTFEQIPAKSAIDLIDKSDFHITQTPSELSVFTEVSDVNNLNAIATRPSVVYELV